VKNPKKNKGLPISKLPKYNPESVVWDRISAELDQQELPAASKVEWPKYQPSPEVWSAIDSELELKRALGELPTYQPPFELWTNLSEVSTDRTQTNRFHGVKFWLKIAAGITLLIVAGIAAQMLIDNESNVEYSVEWTDADEATESYPSGISGNEMIAKLCATAKEICNTPDFVALENELVRLETARKEVEEQMSPYGDNQDLERLLTRIELEHAEIIKQMSQAIYE
jgi:hypothetical protein